MKRYVSLAGALLLGTVIATEKKTEFTKKNALAINEEPTNVFMTKKTNNNATKKYR